MRPYAERVPNTPYRVVQWTTGNVGKSSVEAIAKNPNYELVGCYAWSKDKAGRDVGELVGIEPLGVKATNDIDALLALKPDCVVYNPMWIDVDELVRILEAGVNVVASASFITGHNLGDGRDKLEEACQRGGSTTVRFRRQPRIRRAARDRRRDRLRPGRQGHHRRVAPTPPSTTHPTPSARAGFGMPIDDPDLQPMMSQGTAMFAEAVRLVADAFGVELDEINCEAEYAQTTEDLVMASWTIPAGHVAGVFASWQGRRRRQDRHRPQRAVEEGPDAGARLEDRRRRLEDHHRRTADGDHAGRLPAAAGHHRERQDDRGLHGARPHHDGDAADPRDPGRRRRRARASPRTTICRCRCRAASCRPASAGPQPFSGTAGSR